MATNRLNYGEWGELYVLLRLCGDGKLNLTDENEEEIVGYYLSLLELMRLEAGDRTVRYRLNEKEDEGYTLVVVTVNDEKKDTRFASEYGEKADQMLAYVKEGLRAPFPVPPELGSFFAEIQVKSYKAKSMDKSDIWLSAADPRSGLVRRDIGYSIKTKWSQKSTLFNTGNGSRSVYKLHGNITDELIDRVNNFVDDDGNADVIGRWAILEEEGIKREFVDYAYCVRARCHAFTQTLDLLNPYAIGMFESIVRARFEKRLPSVAIPEVNEWLIETNPCNLKRPEVQYEYLLKSFLYYSVRDITASTPWDGRCSVNGGMITVKPDGRIVAYNALDGDAFKSYLFHHCGFDFPSTSSGHGNYGRIYWSDEYQCYCFDLNFQIRYENY